MTNKIATTLYIAPELHERLQDEAARTGQPVSKILRVAISKHLDRTAPVGAYVPDAPDRNVVPNAWQIAHSLVDSVATYRERDPGAALPPWYEDNVFGEGAE